MASDEASRSGSTVFSKTINPYSPGNKELQNARMRFLSKYKSKIFWFYSIFKKEQILDYFSTKTYIVGTQMKPLNDGSFEHPKHNFRLIGKKIISLC